MPKKITKNLVSPARQLAQRVSDLAAQQEGLEHQGMPKVMPEDVRNVGPTPTIYNANTGEWEEVTPTEARLMGAPIGPPNRDVLNMMFRSGERRIHSPAEVDFRGDMRT